LRRAKGQHLARRFVQRVQAQAALRAAQAQLAGGDHIDQRVLLEQRDAGRTSHHVDERALHRRPGGVQHVGDAASAVAAFASQVQFAIL